MLVLDPLAALHRVKLSLASASHAAIASALASHDCTSPSVITHLSAVLDAFETQRTSPGVFMHISAIVRAITIIHTPELVERYEAARGEMTRRGIKYKERVMFHGTKEAARVAICREGFKHKHSYYPGTGLISTVLSIDVCGSSCGHAVRLCVSPVAVVMFAAYACFCAV